MTWLIILLILGSFFISKFVVSFHAVHSKVGILRPTPFRQSPTRKTTTKLYGIPKLFRWLVDLYPPVVDSVEKASLNVDNFYLDMNGIIHPCTHANDGKLVPLDEQQMFLRIFLYTDRLYKLVKPKRLLYLAVDGVAPRAKMNQQRSRRYRAGKEREAIIADYVEREGKNSKAVSKSSFDSNCITPGTEFMYRLGTAFRRWIDYKLKNDPFWMENGAAEIVFSGCDIPGEGEHKIMDRIRLDQSSKPSYREQQYRHCMYGLDADLIMLSLVSHEPNFVLLREKVVRANAPKKDALDLTPEDFEVLEVSSVRGMLQKFYHTLRVRKPKPAAATSSTSSSSTNTRPVPTITDNVNTGESHSTNTSTIMDTWRTDRYEEQESTTTSTRDMQALINAARNIFEGKSNSDTVVKTTTTTTTTEPSMTNNQTRLPDTTTTTSTAATTSADVRRPPRISKIEQMRFEMQEMSANAIRENAASQTSSQQNNRARYPLSKEMKGVLTPSQDPLADTSIDFERVIDDFVFMCFFVGNDFIPCLPHMDIADGALNLMMITYREIFPHLGGFLTHKNKIHFPRVELFIQELARREPLYFAQRGIEENVAEFMNPTAYVNYYYQTKFEMYPDDTVSKRHLIQSYLEGLTWVLTYYHYGCGSWNWFYPHLYAPLASDLRNLSSYDIQYEKGRPFTPLLQLLAVLPPQSSSFLPGSYRDLMLDPTSPLAPYYPLDFTVDTNGKRNAWEAIVKIPFIHEDSLLSVINKINHTSVLTPAERLRNKPGEEYVVARWKNDKNRR